MLVLAGAAGLGLGALFFGGLWWTVQKGVASPRPAVWFLGSLLVRTGLTLGGLYAVSGGDWPRLLACLLGFLAARVGVTVLTRPAGEPAADPIHPTQGAGRASQSR
ncbi:Sodium-transporting ATPase subunit R [Frigoriglobus tundricola]|uniref:Sodium-transporting ATPase subunit R n=1 Tax=Frigoriglobus tundricola TaxID=2774151 RepID=A0A6M5YUW4_9BACT|nr:Sodium-transporting ATPase subunit R [Frigoriglobus tundricola]